MSNNNVTREDESRSLLETSLTTLAIVAALAIAFSGCAPSAASPLPTQGMVFVPAGEFIMGSEVGLTDEQPAHTVFLDAFWIDQTEVTNAMYNLCVRSSACGAPSVTSYFDDPAYSNHPVVSVSWEDAKAYCAWAGRRLPTEAEWEKAASWDPVTNEKRVYPWGNDLDCKKGNFEMSGCDGYEKTSPVGSFPSGASAFGALDMAGNAWEWVNDAFLETDPFGARLPNSTASPPVFENASSTGRITSPSGPGAQAAKSASVPATVGASRTCRTSLVSRGAPAVAGRIGSGGSVTSFRRSPQKALSRFPEGPARAARCSSANREYAAVSAQGLPSSAAHRSSKITLQDHESVTMWCMLKQST